LIRALIKKTKIILLDEPTSSVDKETEQIIGRLLS
jgi:ABC-type multidrug transport system fused ATPase/permease subunit